MARRTLEVSAVRAARSDDRSQGFDVRRVVRGQEPQFPTGHAAQDSGIQEAANGSIRLVRTADEIDRGLDEFFRLHHLRWRARGGSSALNASVERMIRDVSSSAQRPFAVPIVDRRGGRPSGGGGRVPQRRGETSYWLGGFDDAAARFEPALLTILAAVKHAFEIGDHRMDLGPGDQPYKWRFADGHDVIGWDLLVARGIKAPLARSQMLPWRGRMFLAEHLPPSAKTFAKRVLRAATSERA